jgi:hypothetical protein
MVVQTVRRDGGKVTARLVSCLIERPDLQRFRVVTLHPEPGQDQVVVVPAPQKISPPSGAQLGRVQTLHLDAIREAYGEGWEQAAGRLMMLSESIIKRRLEPDDVMSRTPDQGFVIWFAEADADVVADRIGAIAREIRIRLLGEFGESPLAQVTAVSAPVETPRSTPAPSSKALPGLGERLKELAQQIELTAQRTIEELTRDPPAERLAVQHRDGRPTDFFWLDVEPGVSTRLASALSAAPSRAEATNLDMVRLHLVLAALAQDVAAGRNRICLFPLSCQQLLLRHPREALLAQLTNLPAGLRQRLLPLVTEIPNGMNEARLQEGLQWLAPVVRGLGLLYRAPELPTPNLLRPPFSLLALSAEAGVVPPEAEAYQLFGKARQKGLGVLARLGPGQDAQTWRELGVTMIAMEAVPPPL